MDTLQVTTLQNDHFERKVIPENTTLIAELPFAEIEWQYFIREKVHLPI